MAVPAGALPDFVLNDIAKQIGERLSIMAQSMPINDKSLVEMGETFELWMLEADDIKRPINNPLKLAKQTGRWHHQIRFDGEPAAFARSTRLNTSPAIWSVRELFESQLARRIDGAIEWIDNNILGNSLVRLLTVPAYQVHAFWLENTKEDDQVFIVTSPSRFNELKPNKLLTSQEFLDILSKNSSPPKVALGQTPKRLYAYAVGGCTYVLRTALDQTPKDLHRYPVVGYAVGGCTSSMTALDHNPEYLWDVRGSNRTNSRRITRQIVEG